MGGESFITDILMVTSSHPIGSSQWTREHTCPSGFSFPQYQAKRYPLEPLNFPLVAADVPLAQHRPNVPYSYGSDTTVSTPDRRALNVPVRSTNSSHKPRLRLKRVSSEEQRRNRESIDDRNNPFETSHPLPEAAAIVMDSTDELDDSTSPLADGDGARAVLRRYKSTSGGSPTAEHQSSHKLSPFVRGTPKLSPVGRTTAVVGCKGERPRFPQRSASASSFLGTEVDGDVRRKGNPLNPSDRGQGAFHTLMKRANSGNSGVSSDCRTPLSIRETPEGAELPSVRRKQRASSLDRNMVDACTAPDIEQPASDGKQDQSLPFPAPGGGNNGDLLLVGQTISQARRSHSHTEQMTSTCAAYRLACASGADNGTSRLSSGGGREDSSVECDSCSTDSRYRTGLPTAYKKALMVKRNDSILRNLLSEENEGAGSGVCERPNAGAPYKFLLWKGAKKGKLRSGENSGVEADLPLPPFAGGTTPDGTAVRRPVAPVTAASFGLLLEQSNIGLGRDEDRVVRNEPRDQALVRCAPRAPSSMPTNSLCSRLSPTSATEAKMITAERTAPLPAALHATRYARVHPCGRSSGRLLSESKGGRQESKTVSDRSATVRSTPAPPLLTSTTSNDSDGCDIRTDFREILRGSDNDLKSFDAQHISVCKHINLSSGPRLSPQPSPWAAPASTRPFVLAPAHGASESQSCSGRRLLGLKASPPRQSRSGTSTGRRVLLERGGSATGSGTEDELGSSRSIGAPSSWGSSVASLDSRPCSRRAQTQMIQGENNGPLFDQCVTPIWGTGQLARRDSAFSADHTDACPPEHPPPATLPSVAISRLRTASIGIKHERDTLMDSRDGEEGIAADSETQSGAPPEEQLFEHVEQPAEDPWGSRYIVESLSGLEDSEWAADKGCHTWVSKYRQAINWKRGEQIGMGSFGKVFKGLNESTGELFAVKQIGLTDGTPREINALEAEIELMRNLNHRHIVRYCGTDRGSRHLYFFLEYVPGGSIASMLQQFGVFREDLVRRLTHQILLGVCYLHDKGIIHRDIKGANVLVTEQGIAKLADFGCSKELQGVRTQSFDDSLHAICGSIPWMAPEIIKQTGHGRSADVWSVGATVIEMFTAKYPWPPFSNKMAAMYHVATATQPPAFPEKTSLEVEDFLSRCLIIDPDKRMRACELLQHSFLYGAAQELEATSGQGPGGFGPSEVVDAAKTGS